jgi:predicted PurR-regulated permease PerM
METTFKFPFYAKFAMISIGSIAFICMLYIGQQIILPVIYATIIAILVNLFVNFLVRRKINRLVAIAITVVLAVLTTASVVYFISVQLSMFSDTYPALKIKFNETGDQLIHWGSQYFNIKPIKINKWILESENNVINNLGGTIGETLSVIYRFVIILVLLPVYLFMILFYKDLLLEFIRRLFKTSHHATVFEVLINSKNIIQSYLIGLLVEAAIIAMLNSAGLLFLGIDYAIILGIIGALLNVIPYIGGIIAIALPMIIAYVTKGSTTALLVLGVYLLIQFIDNHLIIPRLVASKVKINALIAVIVVLIRRCIVGCTRNVSFHSAHCNRQSYFRSHRAIETLGIFVWKHCSHFIKIEIWFY